VVVNVPGGTVHGPKINCVVIPPGGDWFTPMPDGTLSPRRSADDQDGRWGTNPRRIRWRGRPDQGRRGTLQQGRANFIPGRVLHYGPAVHNRIQELRMAQSDPGGGKNGLCPSYEDGQVRHLRTPLIGGGRRHRAPPRASSDLATPSTHAQCEAAKPFCCIYVTVISFGKSGSLKIRNRPLA
jgi:hypothetical protein